jgi:ribonuclease BN (tRNA processing enzyme)
MELTVLGCSPALPNPGSASTGYLLTSGLTRLLVDCGHGVCGQLRAAIEVPNLSAIVITHMHPDHYFDLVPLAYAYYFGKLPAIPLHLPPGGRAVLDALASAAGIPSTFFPSLFEIEEYDPAGSLRIEPLSLAFAPIKHYIPGYAIRFQEGDSSLIFTADTARFDPVIELARNATAGLFECAVLRYESENERLGHLDAEAAGTMAKDAGVGSLILTHYPANQSAEILPIASEAFGGPVELARDGATFPI